MIPLRLVLLLASPLIAATTGVAEAPPTLPLKPHAVATLKIAGYPDFLVADGDAVWVANEDRIEKLRADRRKPVATAHMPEPCGAMAVAFGSVWVASCKESALYRINHRTAAVEAVIRTGLADPKGELGIAAGAGSLWVPSDAQGVLSRIDPATNRVVATISVAPASYFAAFGFDAVWVSHTGHDGNGGAVQRIDPRTNRVDATIPVGPSPRFLAVGEGGVWALNHGDGTVSRVDPHTGTLAATVALGVQERWGDIAAGAGRVWVRTTREALLWEIDPATNRIVRRYGPAAGSGAVRVAGGLVWVSAHDTRTVWALRP